jgi:sialidase-1
LTSVQYLWFGDSEGEHWDEPIVLPFWGIVPDKFLQLKNGRMIVSAHTPDESQRLEQFLWYSDDNGQTWSDRVTVASDPRYNLCEISIVPIDDNTLVAFLRENSAKGYDMFKTISYDNGETWSDLIETPFGCGHRPTAGLLQDGRLMVTYRYMAPPMHNFFAGFLDNDSILATTRRGHKSRIMPLAYDRNKVPDMGYSGWVQFPDGEIYVVYYIKDDSEKGNIRGLSMTLDDIEL